MADWTWSSEEAKETAKKNMGKKVIFIKKQDNRITHFFHDGTHDTYYINDPIAKKIKELQAVRKVQQ